LTHLWARIIIGVEIVIAKELPVSFGISTLDADILVIGGGSAGSMAAIRAKEVNPDQKVVVFEKGQVKYSGCIHRGMDALNIVAVPGVSTAAEYLEATHLACEGIVDDGTSYAMVARSWPLVEKLLGWGVCFPRDRAGQFEVLQVHPKGRFCLAMKEPNLKVILAERMAALGCRILDRVMALELLTDDGRVTGAVGMNTRSGELVVCRARRHPGERRHRALWPAGQRLPLWSLRLPGEYRGWLCHGIPGRRAAHRLRIYHEQLYHQGHQRATALHNTHARVSPGECTGQ
jgi:hypothetical protein